MKTIFKLGMEVYDSINFPNISGTVVDIKDYDNVKHIYPIIVKFGNYEIKYTDDGCLSFGGTKTLSTTPYSVELKGFKQLGVVTEEDAIKYLLSTKGLKDIHLVKTDNEVKTYKDIEMYNAFEALRKLILLRDYYNEGWQPNWKDKEEKRFFIEVWDIGFFEEDSYRRQRPLIFKTRSIAKKFIEEQKELLKIAEPLL